MVWHGLRASVHLVDVDAGRQLFDELVGDPSCAIEHQVASTMAKLINLFENPQ